MRTPFLQKVAEVYAENEADNLYQYCFVLPNRRSRTFFESYLTEALSGKNAISPELTTISDFIGNQSDKVEAGRVEQLLLLYQSYRNLSEKHNAEYSSFDQFLHLGDMLLSDFNDIDRYMVDAKELFGNLNNINDIQTDFLTDEQRKVIKEYWGVDKTASGQDSLFVQPHYFNLWKGMYELYASFQKDLADRKLTYSGLSYRVAAEKIEQLGASDFNFSRIVMVGFSTLSKSEEKIFERFRNLGVADFYWDFESPFLDDYNKGSHFVKRYIKEFPSRYDILSKTVQVPNINILSVPTGTGQGQAVGSILSKMLSEGRIKPDNAIDTAIVLPEEKYVNSVLASIPSDFKTINITMGLSVGQSPIASFLSSISDLEHKKRDIEGVVNYFYEDIEMVASHPYSVMMCGKAVDELLGEIRRNNAFFVPITMVSKVSESLSTLFDISGKTPIGYLKNLLNGIYTRLADGGRSLTEQYFVGLYVQALNQIENTLKKFDIDVEKQSLLFMLSRAMSGAIVPFEGKPLQGLQVMGVLETRLLDFKNIIILSMNEKVFPTKHYTKSFIPNSIRSAYGLSTFKYQDAMYAYYFFRMISRAENVFLLYDSRVQGISSGEESRYIKQLMQVYNRGNNNEFIYDYSIIAPGSSSISIKKTHRILEILDRFKNADAADRRYLSASSINTYIDCPLKFYFQKVEGFQEELDVTDFIDSPTFGQAVHGAMELIYGNDRHIDSRFFDKYLTEKETENGEKKISSTVELEKVVTYVVNKYYKRYEDSRCQAKLTGEASLIGKIVEYYVRYTLFHDKRLGDFDYVSSEKKIQLNWDFGDGVSMNFKGFIDRIDRLDGKLRIVDYKTGGDDVLLKKPDTVADLFIPDSNGNRKKAILQILLYCNAYALEENFDGPITPVIYKLRDLRVSQNERFTVLAMTQKKGERKRVMDYKTDINNSEFVNKIKEIVGQIFDPKIDFRQTEHTDKCVYCQFAKICNRDEN